MSIERITRNLRRRGAMAKSRTQARTAPPRVYQGIAGGNRFAAVHEFWFAVVETVSVAVPAPDEVMVTGLVTPKPRVGGS